MGHTIGKSVKESNEIIIIIKKKRYTNQCALSTSLSLLVKTKQNKKLRIMHSKSAYNNVYLYMRYNQRRHQR